MVQLRDPKLIWPPTVLDLSHLKQYATDIYSHCIVQCTPGDFVCIETCWREYDENKLLCPCQSGCPKGCPCPDYQCPAETTTSIVTTTETTTTPYVPRNSVLILAHSTKAIITDGSGKEEHPVKDFLFMFCENTEAHASCSVTWRGELFIFVSKNDDKFQNWRVVNLSESV